MNPPCGSMFLMLLGGVGERKHKSSISQLSSKRFPHTCIVSMFSDQTYTAIEWSPNNSTSKNPTESKAHGRLPRRLHTVQRGRKLLASGRLPSAPLRWLQIQASRQAVHSTHGAAGRSHGFLQTSSRGSIKP